MKNRIISLILILVLTVSAFSGCGSKQVVKNPTSKQERKPQLVVAMNPILAYEEGNNKIAFNDIKNAMSADQKAATLTSLSDDTDWLWAYKTGEDWKKRGIYGLEKWRNGGYISTDKLSAYSFMNDGTVSIMPYTTKAAKLTTYQGEKPTAAGILLSVSGKEEEALCLQITESGTIGIPSGKITAIKSVGGVKTGFLAEDGTNRSAVIKFIVNTREVWSGEFCNSTAGDGTAVTELEYPDIPDIEVNEGDLFFITMKLDAQLNEDDDQQSEDETDTDDEDNDTSGNKNEPISLMNGYDSRFRIVYPTDSTVTQKQIFTKLRKHMVDVFEADVLFDNDTLAENEYELLIGLTNRKESAKAYKELTSYRANNGADFIIRMDGKKLIIAANTDYSLKLAVDYFMANYCKTDKDSIPANLKYVSRPKLANIIIGDTNIAAYTIRTEKYPSIMTVKAAESLVEYVVKKTGYNLKIEKDTVTTSNEILIGLTTRSGISGDTFKASSLDFLTGKRGHTYNNEDYNIFVDGSKLFVEAGSDYAASHAVSKLITQLDKVAVFDKNTVLSGSYNKGEYTLLNDYAYTWGDEFYSSSGTTMSKKNWKVMEKGYTEDEGCWYAKNDPYYLASKASLEDDDPNNDFGGPWVQASNPNYVQEGTIKNLGTNSVIRDNMLVQISKKEVNGYSGNIICTDGRMEFRYGILEARIMASTSNGNAACFWTRTKDGGSVVNEIDIYENFGEDKLRPNLHTWADTHTDHGKMISLRETCVPAAGETFSDTFHHLALEWTPEFINMYLDGEIYLSQEITSDVWYAFEETTYVIFNNTAPSATYAAGRAPGNWLAGGNVAPNEAAKLFDTNGDGKVNIEDFYEEQLIDYIRLYQINSRQYSLKAKK
ncbi:MAG: glycosyl hydrolase family protein [Ruminococcaceae bacterium]|nr:glycosyl hydrolase family protein [Oscillospiraceae bacterium]